MASVNMKDTEYYKSGKHLKNAKDAAAKGIASQMEKKRLRVEEYNKCPRLCGWCKGPIQYEKKANVFCSSSCSASFNNRKRTEAGWKPSEEHRRKTSVANKNKKPKAGVICTGRNCSIFLIECVVCHKKKFVGARKKTNTTCGSAECKIEASVGKRSYQNGSRKPTWYYNKWVGKEVLLESGWEVSVAEYLDARDIEWVRPPKMKWVDSNGKTRWYFPDFLLPQCGVYLDPKNPYCMVQDEEKMTQVSKRIHVIYGDIQLILDFIDCI